MKVCVQVIAVVSFLYISIASAMAHPGHTFSISNGHVHTVEYAVIAIVSVALLGIMAKVLWGRGR